MRFRLLSGCFSFLCLLFTNAPALSGGTTPSVALSTSSTSVTEGANSSITVEITISWAQEQAHTFGLQFQGPGVVNEDFVDLPQNIEIPSGATKGTVTIAIQDDTFIEGVETVTASINNLPDGIDRAEQSEATFKIEDNDFATIRLSASSTRKTEGSPAFQFDVELDTMAGTLKKDLVISLSLDASNRAVGTFGDNTTPLIPGQDFRIFPDQITFPSGSPNGDKKSVEAVFHSDNRIEGEENATIKFESSSDTAISTLSASHTFMIQDQNSPMITFSRSETLLTEGESDSTIGIKLDLGTDQLETGISFKLIPNPADTASGNFPLAEVVNSNTQGIDYNISPSILSFQLEGQTLLNIAVEALQDQLVEGDEMGTLSIQLTSPGFPQFTPPTAHAIKISDADRATVQFETARSEVSETDQPTNLNAILDTGKATLGAPLRITVVNRNIGQAIGRFGNTAPETNAAPASNSDDFELTQTVFEFSAGDKNQTVRSLPIRSLTDLLIEGTESATLGLSVTSGPVSLGDRKDHTYIIADNNSATVEFARAEASFDEDTTNQEFNLVLNTSGAFLAVPVEVRLGDTGNSSAIGDINSPPTEALEFQADNVNTDYTIPNSSVTFPSGSGDQTTQTVSANILADQRIEGEEIANLGFDSVTGPASAGTTSGFILKINDLNRASVTFVRGTSSVNEANGPNHSISVQLSTSGASLAKTFSTSFAFTDRSAARISDFQIPNSLTIDWLAGTVGEETKSISIPIVDDELLEATESFEIDIQAPSLPLIAGSNLKHTVSITDNDQATIGLVPIQTTASEDGDPIDVAIELSKATSTITEVIVELGGDAGANTSQLTRQIAAGETRFLMRLFVVDDDIVEGPETVTLRLASITSGDSDIQIDTENQQKSIIVADNDTSIVSLEATTNAMEDEKAGELTIKLSKAVTQPLNFDLSFTGTATGNTDYVTPSTQITVPAQATSHTVNFPVIADNLAEQNESIITRIAGNNLLAYWDFNDNSNPSLATDAIDGLSGFFEEGASYSNDGEGFSGISGDRALDLGDSQSGQLMRVTSPFLNDASANNQISIVLRQKLDRITEAAMFKGVSHSSSGESRGLSANAPWSDGIIYFDTAGCCEPGVSRLSAPISTHEDTSFEFSDWHTFTYIKDGDSKSIWIDNQLFAQGINTAPLPNDFSEFVLGANSNGIESMVGLLDDVAIFDRPLLPNEIAAIANGAKPNSLFSESNPIGLPISVQAGPTEILIIDDDHTPEANADLGQLFTINEDETLTLSTENGLLANDTDIDDGNGPSNLTASVDGSLPANAQSFTLNPDGSFTYQPTLNFNGTDTFRYRASDGTNQSESTLVTITVTPVNDAPSIQGPETQLVNEGGQIIFSAATENQIIVNDVDLDESPLELSLSSVGALTLASVDGLAISQGSGQGNTSMIFTGSPSSINRALDGLIYQTPSGAAPDLLNLAANDRGNSGAGGVQETRRSIPITIRSLNAAPQLELTDLSPINVIGSSSRAAIAPGLIVSDGNDAELDSAQVSISSGFNAGQDELFLPRLPDGLTGEFDSNTGALNLRGPAPIASYQAALRGVSFGNSSVTPDTTTRQLSIVVSDGKASSNTIVRDINVSIPAFPPILNARTSQSRTFTEGGFPLALLGNVSISEGTGGQITRATATISSGYLSGEDKLSGGTAAGLESNFDPSTGTLTVIGSGTTGAFSSALASVLYSNTSDSPSSGERTITFSIEDSQRSGNSVSATISVISVNDAPRIQASTSTPRTFHQGDSPISLFREVSISDSDDNQLGGATVMFSTRFLTDQDSLELGPLLAGLSSTGFDKENGSLSITGIASFSDYIEAIQSIAFSNTADFTTDRSPSVSLMVADPDGATSNSVTQRLSLVGRSTPPEIIGLSDVSFPEDTKVFEIPFSLRDDRTPSPEIKFEFKLIEADAFFPKEDGVLFERSNGNAVLSLHPLPNAAGEFSIEATATDAQSLETKLRIIVTIENINDLPLLAASPLEPLVFLDGSGPRSLFDTFEIKDPDHKILFGAKLSFNSGFIPHQDSLELRPAGPIQAEYDRNTGTINLTGKGSPEEYSETIQSITYKNLSHFPSESKRSLEIVVMDTPETASKPVMMEIQVFDANLPPAGQPDRIATEGETNIEIPFTTLLENDSDPENERLSISLVSDRTQQGIFLSTRANSVILSSPPAGVRDHFFYTVADPSGGYSIVRVTIEP